MRKLIFILVLGVQSTFAQHIGFNGSGLFENYDADVEQYLAELNAPFTIRFPGGSISKFHDPYNVRKGWGLSETSIENGLTPRGLMKMEMVWRNGCAKQKNSLHTVTWKTLSLCKNVFRICRCFGY